MQSHHLECVDPACGHIFEGLVRTVECVLACPRCLGPRERHNAVARTKWRTDGQRVEVYDARCPACQIVETGIETPVGAPSFVLPVCEKCDQPTQIVVLPPRVMWTADPVVVYKAADGTYRFPGDANGSSAANYARQGYERVELRNFADVRRFEKHMNQTERAQMARRVEVVHRGRQLQEGESRGELFRQMKSFSRQGRDVAQESIRIGNARPQPQTHDVGFRVEVYSDDKSNREASRGSDGRRRRD